MHKANERITGTKTYYNIIIYSVLLCMLQMATFKSSAEADTYSTVPGGATCCFMSEDCSGVTCYTLPGDNHDAYVLLGCTVYSPSLKGCTPAIRWGAPEILYLDIWENYPNHSTEKFKRIDMVTHGSGSACYYSYTYFYQLQKSCDLKISHFSGNNATLDLTAGGSVTFTGTIYHTSSDPISWTVDIAGQMYSGTGTDVSVTWNGRNVNGTAVAPGTYTATLKAWHTDDPTCGDQKDIQITVVSSCNLSGLTVSPSEVWPARTEDGIFTQATVGISLANPAPASGCEVRLRVEPVDGSGGHNHDGNRSAHTGTVDSNIVDFVPGESILNVMYNSGEVSGTERIIAESLDGNGSVTSTQSISVDVKVPDLVSLGGFMSYQLVGSLDAHPANHYGLISTVTAIGNVADQYYIETGALLGINDMSLQWGGLFDICGIWSPSGTCSNAPNGGHRLHRMGMSVDINGSAYLQGRYIVVDLRTLKRIAEFYDGRRIPEGTIHYEFQ